MPATKKQNIAIVIAIVFHFFGAIGIIFSPLKDWFIQCTSINLLVMFGLIIYTQISLVNTINYKRVLTDNKPFIYFILLSFFIGYWVEVIGVNTGLLFGNYKYGNALGIKMWNVPLLIGVQWFVTTYCCGVCISFLNNWVLNRASLDKKADTHQTRFLPLIFIFDAALLTTFFDYIIEPVAQKLGYWEWQNQEIPTYNYTCWFLISCIIFAFFGRLKFNKLNIFAVHLLIIETIFFLAIRLLVK
jgi:bisanhydrobacterioruberin hydratase